jgi:hypothetical protein
MGLETAAVIALGLTSAGIGAAGQIAQNKNAKAQGKALRQAQGVQQQQLVNREQLERKKREAETSLFESKLRVLAGESGIAIGGSINDLSRQNEFKRAMGDEVGRINLGNSLNALSTGVQAQQIQIDSQRQSPIFAGLLGGITGAQAGLAIGGAIKEWNNPPIPVRNGG